jgi:chorismate mutase
MNCRGVRGAITVKENEREEILRGTRRLLAWMIHANGIRKEDVASVIFTATPDLNAAFPAAAARQIGWDGVPLLCTHEMGVPGALPRCIRILIHWNTERSQAEITHVYLEGAASLRPDLPLPELDDAEIERWIEDRMSRTRHLSSM